MRNLLILDTVKFMHSRGGSRHGLVGCMTLQCLAVVKERETRTLSRSGFDLLNPSYSFLYICDAMGLERKALLVSSTNAATRGHGYS
jgi:hypothetical protein